MTPKEFYIENFKIFQHKLNGESKSFLNEFRKESFNKFSSLEFPTNKNEDWKYTDTAPVLKHNFLPLEKADTAGISGDEIKKHLFKNIESHLLVFIDGFLSPQLSSLYTLPKGVFIGSLNDLSKSNPAVIEQHLNKISDQETAFSALNGSYAMDGLAVIIPEGTILERPVQVLFLNGGSSENLLSVPRNLIIAGKNSNLKLIMSYKGYAGKNYLSNIVTEIFAGENSVLDICKVQDENENSYHIEKLQAIQKSGSVLNHYNISFGGSIVRNDINSVLDGEKIETHYYGLYLATGNQHMDNHTFVDHAKPDCMSNELYKGILDGNSRGVFNGKIIVRKDAQKTNAYQQNKTILLSKNATIDTKPQLEIFADDVKCSHGATVGHLDETSEFYIRSRGVPQELAKSMLIRAFASDVIENLKIEELKEQINHLIFEHLHKIEI